MNGSFADGIFTFAGEFEFNKGDIVLSTSAGLNVPESILGVKIPVIGGDHLASANLLFEYNDNLGSGYFAGWVHIPIVGDLGIKVTIPGRRHLVHRGQRGHGRRVPLPQPRPGCSTTLTRNNSPRPTVPTRTSPPARETLNLGASGPTPATPTTTTP